MHMLMHVPTATIALMAKFKPSKGKRRGAPVPQGAVPCVILVISAIALAMLLVFFYLKNAS